MKIWLSRFSSSRNFVISRILHQGGVNSVSSRGRPDGPGPLKLPLMTLNRSTALLVIESDFSRGWLDVAETQLLPTAAAAVLHWLRDATSPRGSGAGRRQFLNTAGRNARRRGELGDAAERVTLAEGTPVGPAIARVAGIDPFSGNALIARKRVGHCHRGTEIGHAVAPRRGAAAERGEAQQSDEREAEQCGGIPPPPLRAGGGDRSRAWCEHG